VNEDRLSHQQPRPTFPYSRRRLPGVCTGTTRPFGGACGRASGAASAWATAEVRAISLDELPSMAEIIEEAVDLAHG
jgi:hypothetical protein